MKRWHSWRNSELCLKLRMLWMMRWLPRVWYAEVWKQDASARICCDGYMCGCQGSDYWAYWEHLLEHRL